MPSNKKRPLSTQRNTLFDFVKKPCRPTTDENIDAADQVNAGVVPQTVLPVTVSVDEINETSTMTIVTKTKPTGVRSCTVKGWKLSFIEFTEESGIVLKVRCSFCRAFPEAACSKLNAGHKQLVDTNAYVTGTSAVKKVNAINHEKSYGHQAALLKKMGEKREFADRQIVKAVSSLTQDQQKRMCQLFHIAYHIAYTELPFSQFAGLIHLNQKYNLNVGETYANNVQCSNFIAEIDNMMELELKSNLNKKTPIYPCYLMGQQTNPAMRRS